MCVHSGSLDVKLMIGTGHWLLLVSNCAVVTFIVSLLGRIPIIYVNFLHAAASEMLAC